VTKALNSFVSRLSRMTTLAKTTHKEHDVKALHHFASVWNAQ